MKNLPWTMTLLTSATFQPLLFPYLVKKKVECQQADHYKDTETASAEIILKLH